MSDAGSHFLGYLRTGIKILALLIVAMIVTLAFNVAFMAAVLGYYAATTGSVDEALSLMRDSLSNIWMMLGLTVTQEIAWVLVPIGFIILVDRRRFSWRELGLTFSPRAAKMFAAGIIVNALTGLAIIGTIVLSGLQNVEINGLAEYGLPAVAGSLALTVVIMLAVGIGEETLFRGYIQTDLMRKYGVAVALVVTSLIFAGIHIFFLISGQEVSPLSIAGIFFAGLVMGYLYVITGTIWASIGFHFLQDVLAAGVFLTGDLPYVSYPVFTFSKAGNVVMAGINLGSRDNLVNIAALIVLLAVLYYYRTRIQKPRADRIPGAPEK
jgi:uncharacterized protein